MRYFAESAHLEGLLLTPVQAVLRDAQKLLDVEIDADRLEYAAEDVASSTDQSGVPATSKPPGIPHHQATEMSWFSPEQSEPEGSAPRTGGKLRVALGETGLPLSAPPALTMNSDTTTDLQHYPIQSPTPPRHARFLGNGPISSVAEGGDAAEQTPFQFAVSSGLDWRNEAKPWVLPNHPGTEKNHRIQANEATNPPATAARWLAVTQGNGMSQPDSTPILCRIPLRPKGASFAQSASEILDQPSVYSTSPKKTTLTAARLGDAVAGSIEQAYQLTQAQLKEFKATEPEQGATGQVRNTFNISVTLDGNPEGMDRIDLEDALTEVLRTAARRHGLEV